MLEIVHIPWLQPALMQVIHQLNNQSLGHALLIGASCGYGGDLLAKRIAAAALCQHIDSNGACGKCKSCQLFKAGNHPDFYQVIADGKQIKVDQIRYVCDKLHASSQQGGIKVVTIGQAEKMNLAAASALLKTLEEPNNQTFLILQTDCASQLLPTVMSRCQKIKITTPNNQFIQQWLHQEYQIVDNLEWLLPITDGPLALIDIWKNGHYQDLQHLRQDWINSLKTGHLVGQLCNLSEDNVINALKILYIVFRQRLLHSKKLDPFMKFHISQLGAKVMTQCHYLQVMPTVNYLALFQGYITEYKKIIH